MLAALAWPVAVHADDDAAARAESKKLYEQGLVHYNLGEYDKAIEVFKRGYKIFQAPGFLYNLGQAYRLKGDCERARIMYRNYLRAVPDDPNREIITQQIDEMAACARKAGTTGTVAEDDPAGTDEAPVEGEKTTIPKAPQDGGRQAPGQVATVDHGADTGRGKRITGIGVAAAGLAFVGAGVYFGIDAADASDEVSRFYEMGGTWNPEIADVEARGKRSELLSISLLGVGGAAMVGGAVLYYLGMSADDGAPAVSMSTTGDRRTLVFTWQY